MIENKKYNIGITGSNEWQNKTQIKEIIFKLKKQYNSDFVIVTRGSLKGVDSLVRKYALEFDCNFAEFTPRHLSKTLYSVDIKFEKYNQPWASKDIYIQGRKFVKMCHAFIIFKNGDDDPIDKIIKEITKLNKKFKLFESYEAVGNRRS